MIKINNVNRLINYLSSLCIKPTIYICYSLIITLYKLAFQAVYRPIFSKSMYVHVHTYMYVCYFVRMYIRTCIYFKFLWPSVTNDIIFLSGTSMALTVQSLTSFRHGGIFVEVQLKPGLQDSS